MFNDFLTPPVSRETFGRQDASEAKTFHVKSVASKSPNALIFSIKKRQCEALILSADMISFVPSLFVDQLNKICMI